MVDPVSGHHDYEGWISIPYLTPAGPVGIKFRRPDEEGQPKYLFPPRQKMHLYNVPALHRAEQTIAVCEGELDALVCDAIVGIPAVGVAGVNNWADHFPRVLEGFEKILVLADNDVKEDGRNPGRELANRVMEDLPQSTLVELPKGYDINRMVVDLGVSSVLELIDA